MVEVVDHDCDIEYKEKLAEGHLAMHFERRGEVVDPGREIMPVEVVEGHLAMHFGVT